MAPPYLSDNKLARLGFASSTFSTDDTDLVSFLCQHVAIRASCHIVDVRPSHIYAHRVRTVRVAHSTTRCGPDIKAVSLLHRRAINRERAERIEGHQDFANVRVDLAVFVPLLQSSQESFLVQDGQVGQVVERVDLLVISAVQLEGDSRLEHSLSAVVGAAADGRLKVMKRCAALCSKCPELHLLFD